MTATTPRPIPAAEEARVRSAGPRRLPGGRAGRLTTALLGAALLALPVAACGEAEPGADAGGGTTDTAPTADGTPDTAGAGEGPGEDTTDGDAGSEAGDGTGEAAEGNTGTEGATGTPAPDPASPDDPLVFNYFGAEDGRADRAPDNLVLTEFSTLNEVTWESWGEEQAVGNGLLSGTWCLPECLDDPFPARVVLTDPEEINGDPYFTAFEVEITDPSGYSQQTIEAAETEGFLGRP
ncbi:hypothetical protein FNQ90_11020 [Streptomyces alkaliphilus]|uniref:Uncharacterized protein n=1 Tax=Streptomyces alkaliphilus TaxID=1472722 RepID=A0A7W3TD03_9ACTN|nr:hypothetical protein [Streptomyces alkaliphilus]MBB0244619.1 hypothetical protein [Streptomyces alkaliphilus]